MTESTPDQEAVQPTPAGRSGRAIFVFLSIIVIVLGADLWLKSWSFKHVAEDPVRITPQINDDPEAFWSGYRHRPMVIVPKVLHLQLTSNRGAVFGLGAGNRGLFIVVSVLATAVIGFLFWRSSASAWPQHLALALILGGALGNLYDRVVYAVVRDMLHMLPGVELPFGLAWPGGMRDVWPWIFNLADVALMVGVGMVLVMTWVMDRRKAKVQAVGTNPEAV